MKFILVAVSVLLFAAAVAKARQDGFDFPRRPGGFGPHANGGYRHPPSPGFHGPPPPPGPHRPSPPPSTAQSPQPAFAPAVNTPVETKTLDQLYADALAEGGRVIVYAGGDTADQQDAYKRLFEARFPNITFDVIVDYSKYHNARIDNQIANNRLIPDVVQLQTLQDFPRWRDRNLLMSYKPRSWDAIYDEFKDPSGYYTGMYILSFSILVNSGLLPDKSTWPTDAYDLLRSDLKGKLAVTYPNDDDAVLYLFKQYVDKYGWDFVEKFVKQNPTLVRGTHAPGGLLRANQSLVAVGVAGSLSAQSPTTFVVPKVDPFVTWPQTAAIFKNAKHPAAAKLFLNWMTDKETHEKYIFQWSTRKDVSPPAGYKNVFGYPRQTDPTAFGKWMADRGAVELFRTQIQLYMGEVKGDPTPGYLGLYPEKALPH